MNASPQIWHIWARTLHRWGVQHLAAALLESSGALTILGAQAIYLGQPLFSRAGSGKPFSALAELLENPGQARQFAAFLREGSWQ